MNRLGGIYRSDGCLISEEEIRDLGGRLSPGAGTGVSVWRSGAAGLATAGPCAPVQDGAFAVAAAARLENAAELAELLGVSPSDDASLILYAYRRWGDECPSRLSGEFAFVIVQPGVRVFAARDRFGLKPLFYRLSPSGSFAFASTIRGLLHPQESRAALHIPSIGAYVAGVLLDPEVTFYEDIRRLPAGHCLTLSRGSPNVRPYAPRADTLEDPGLEIADYARTFKELFTQAVRHKLPPDGRAGACLSGGLDSSAIACIASDFTPAFLPTFSAVFPDLPECDERGQIETVLSRGGMTPHFVRADRTGPLTGADEVYQALDEPSPAPNLYINRLLCRRASDEGVSVLLSGQHGDEVVGHGLRYLAELATRGEVRRLAKEVRDLSRRPGVSSRTLLWRQVVSPLLPEWARRVRRRIRRDPFIVPLHFLTGDLLRQSDLPERLRQLRPRRPARTAREMQAEQLFSPMIPQIHEVAEHEAAAFGLEMRFPFLFSPLVDFCLTIPGQQRLEGGMTRMVLRRAMEGVLPDEIRWRRDKADLSANFNRGLVTFDRELVEEVLADGSGMLAPYLRLDAVRHAYGECLEGNFRYAVLIWRAVQLGVWLRRGPGR